MTAIDKHLKESRDWYADRYGSIKTQRNIAIGFAVLTTLLASAACFAVAALAPLKTVEPYLVRVDRSSGDVSVMSALKAGDQEWADLTAEEALTQSFLVRYVVARETYSNIDLTRNFDTVRVMSAPGVFREYDALWRDKINGPFAKYKDDTVQVSIKSVAFLNQNTATVRFRTIWKQSVGNVTNDYIGIVRFNYSKTPSVLDDRWKNPLGFVVSDYRVDQEKLEKTNVASAGNTN